MAYWLDIGANMASPVEEPEGYDNEAVLWFDHHRAHDRWQEKPTPLPDHLIFRNLLLKTTPGKNGPGILVGFGAGNLGVREDFKDAIEEVEPGVHEFFPLSVTTRGGKPFPKRYFLLNIMQCFDAIIVEKSDARWEWVDAIKEIYGERQHLVFRHSRQPNALVMSCPKIDGRHLWVGANLLSGRVFISDDLFEAFRKRGLTRFFRLVEVTEIDEPWDREANIGEYLRNREEMQSIADLSNTQTE